MGILQRFAMRGWLLLRYSWEDVILDEHWVGDSLGAVIAGHAARQNSLDAVA